MRARDTFDVACSTFAVVADALAVFAGFMLAVWIRFDSGWLPLFHERTPPRMMYVYGAGVATLLFLFIFRTLGLYARPQYGHFIDKIPRIIRACGLGILLALALAFVIRTEQPFSRIATALALLTVSVLVVIERNILFQSERHWAKHQAQKKNVILLGTGSLAARMKQLLEGEPRRRARIAAYVRMNGEDVDPALPAELVRPSLDELPRLLDQGDVDEVILVNPSSLSHERMVDLILQCERAMAGFQMVPDMFRLLTSKVNVQTMEEVPLLGVGKWPLDIFWNRTLKRVEDVLGASVGLLLSVPIIAVAAVLIKRGSPGPVFYRQDRCGEKGRIFTLYKLRTMPVDAEKASGPVWTAPDDPRRTAVGAFLRRYNLDELPQFWNVLKGDMSLVGPRPERPFFVEQFKDDISRYMWRHVSTPGMTGWAQVNGFRGQTDLRKRIELDLYYLENWSLAFDFKILARTLFNRENAY
jgi:exopolysaccharide biosynthesis polyprenyl glycosylphosphotransferase